MLKTACGWRCCSRSMPPPAGQPPHQERVDGAKQHLATLRPRSQPGYPVQQVRDLAAGKIGVEHESRLFAERRPRARRPSAARRSGADPALPDDGIADRFSRVAAPTRIVVSRWLVTPTARQSSRRQPACSQRLMRDSSCDVQIASGSCSTCPGEGRICEIPAGPWRRSAVVPKTMARLEVVP